MDEWFEEIVRDVIWRALRDAYGELTGLAHSELQQFLHDLDPSDPTKNPLSSSPLVAVTAWNAGSLRFLVRGRQKLFGGAVAPFLRIEATISRTVPAGLDPPVDITGWHTVIGDLQIAKKDVFRAELGFGWDQGVWLGRGMFKILPAGFGLDVLLGGLSDRGVMVGLDVDFPAPIPLGSTGLALVGVGGDFAYNFVPRLEKAGIAIPSPTAADYVRWARNPELDRWDTGPIDETAVGTGIRADLQTLLDNGFLVKLEPIGLAVLVPGPVFVLGGKGKLVRTDSATIEGYLAVDVASASMALGLGVEVKIPKDGELILLHAQGTLDAFFSFADPSLWYVNFGTNKAPVKGKVLKTYDAELFFMINNDRVLFGAGVSIGGKWKWSIVELTARIGARVAALVGWNPQELEGAFKLWGELGLKVWKIGLSLLLEAEAIGHTPKPTLLQFQFGYKVDLPWPVPDIKGKKTVSLPEAEPEPPALESPLLSGTWVVGDGDPTGPLQLGAVHPITGRQWQLDHTTEAGEKLWPDAEIVLPFSRRVVDTTGTVVGATGVAEVHGGYDVTHELTKVELRDLVTDTLVPGVTGVWAAGPGGDSARLHLLGQDPFAWLTPHTDTAESAHETPPAVVDQYFGIGPPETFTGPRRFGKLVVDPDDKATLENTFSPPLPTRVVRSDALTLSFSEPGGKAIPVDYVVLFLILPKTKGEGMLAGVGLGNVPPVHPSVGFAFPPIPLFPIQGDMWVSAVVVLFPAPVSSVHVATTIKVPMLLYGVRYRRAPLFVGTATSKTVLDPSHYRLTVEGRSTATFTPDPGQPDLPDAFPVSWQVEKEFWVGPPESLRPYIRSTTAGDNRIFLAEPPWNPTMLGTGFPAYRRYQPVVRFLVPYMNQIFSPVRVSIGREAGPAVQQMVTPTANPHGESSLPAASQSWLTAHGGTAPPDQELVFTAELPASGPAALTLSFDVPGGGTVGLDRWGMYISQYDRFRDHVAWPGQSLMVWYDALGRHTRPACPTLPLSTTPSYKEWVPSGSHIDSLLGRGRFLRRAPALRVGPQVVDEAAGAPMPPPRQPPAKAGPAPGRSGRAGPGRGTAPPVTGGSNGGAMELHGPLLASAYPGVGDIVIATYPEELTAPAAGWPLPAALTQHLAPLDDDTGVRFLRFASDTGARFNDGTGDRMAEIGDTVDAPTIEAVVDGSGRPHCLWLRTKEPLDWRRVTADLRIHHVVQPGPCPSGYAYRLPLNLEVECLPSPDGSSAFLVGSLAGVRTRLPRGEYRLTLVFEPEAPGLPRLRPTAVVGPVPETTTLTFIQPLGVDWPLAKPPIGPPPELSEFLPKKRWIDPTIVFGPLGGVEFPEPEVGPGGTP